MRKGDAKPIRRCVWADPTSYLEEVPSSTELTQPSVAGKLECCLSESNS